MEVCICTRERERYASSAWQTRFNACTDAAGDRRVCKDCAHVGDEVRAARILGLLVIACPDVAREPAEHGKGQQACVVHREAVACMHIYMLHAACSKSGSRVRCQLHTEAQ